MNSGFSVLLEQWHGFYSLLANAAATLMGLMFLSVTFGSSLVTPETSGTARAFTNPTFTHFLQVLLISAILMIPGLSPRILGVFLIAMCVMRLIPFIDVVRHVVRAHRRVNDLELSDWLYHLVFPFSCYLLLSLAGILFWRGSASGFTWLAIAVLGLLTIGVEGAWEMLIWMAPQVNRKRE
jgi:hypothetical protein